MTFKACVVSAFAALAVSGSIAGAKELSPSADTFIFDQEMPFWQCVDKADEVAAKFKLTLKPFDTDGFAYFYNSGGDPAGTAYYRASTCHIYLK